MKGKMKREAINNEMLNIFEGFRSVLVDALFIYLLLYLTVAIEYDEPIVYSNRRYVPFNIYSTRRNTINFITKPMSITPLTRHV